MGSSIKKVGFDKNRWSKFTRRVWNVNLFCLILFVPDKCVPNVNTRCLLPWHITEGSSNASSSLTEAEGNTSGSHYWKLFRLWSDVRKLLGSNTQPSITMRITQLARWQTRDKRTRESHLRLRRTQLNSTRCVQDIIFFMHILIPHGCL